MSKITGYWGIDIGQCALKALRLELVDGKPTATAFDYIEHPKILSQPDADPDALTREALEKFLSRNEVKHDMVAISVAGQSGLARFVKLPPVEEKKISDIVKFEAKQQIPFPLEEVVWDYQKVGGGENIGGFAMETEIGLFAMKRDIINRHLGHYHSVKAEVHIVQMAPLALCNYANYEILKRGGVDGIDPTAATTTESNDDTPRGKKRCAVILDIGTENSNLIITDGGKIIWQRPVPLGGNNFTRALTKELKLTFAKAEHLKRNAAKSPELAQILKALRPVLTDFVGEVQRSLGYFTNTHRDAHVAYLVGLGSAFKLPGLQKYLSEKLALEVRKPSKMERLSGEQVLTDPNFTDNILTFPVAYGLALQATGLGRLQTNLLPGEIRTDRLIRAKKPWAAAAAAALLLGTGAVAFGYGTQYQALSDERIAKSMAKAETTVKAARTQEDDRTKKEGEKNAAIAEVKAIVSGNEERLNWARLLELISAALPVPGVIDKGRIVNTGNLELPDQQNYWKTEKQQNAIAKHFERIASGVPLAKLYDDDKSEDLATVNVEAVDCRYSENVQAFLINAQGWAEKTSGLNLLMDFPASVEKVPVEDPTAKYKEAPKAPEGGAWIVEIRGYTYNSDATNFLRKCLVGNLKRSEHFAKTTDPTDKKVAQSLQAESLADPVKGRISHAFLALAYKKDLKRDPASTGTPGAGNATAGNFQYIPKSQLDLLLSPKGSAGEPGAGGPLGGSPMAPGGESPPGTEGPAAAAKWISLLGSSTANNANFFAGGFEGGSPGAAGSGMMPPMGPTGGPLGPMGPMGPGGLGPTSGSGVGAAPSTGARTKYPTEFIVYMIWREPTPTDTPAAPPAAK